MKSTLRQLLDDLTTSVETMTHSSCGLELSYLVDPQNTQQPCVTDDSEFILTGYQQDGAPVMGSDELCHSLEIQWLECGEPTGEVTSNLCAYGAKLLIAQRVMNALCEFEALAI